MEGLVTNAKLVDLIAIDGPENHILLPISDSYGHIPSIYMCSATLVYLDS